MCFLCMELWEDRAASPHPYLPLRLHKQPHRAHVLVAGSRDVPASRARCSPIHFQRDIMPAIRESGPKALAGVDAIPAYQQAGMGVVVTGIGEFNLADLFLHRDSSCVLDYAVQIINRALERILCTIQKIFSVNIRAVAVHLLVFVLLFPL